MSRHGVLLRLLPLGVLFLAAACSTDWPAFRHNNFRSAAQLNASDLSNPAKVPSLAVKWRFPKAGDPDLGGGFRASPVVWKGRVFIGNGNGRLYALDANTGVQLWQYPIASDPPLLSDFVCNPSSQGLASSAAIATIGGQDAVIFSAPDKSIGSGIGDGRLFALDAATGAVIWKSPVLARVTGFGVTDFHENLGYSAPIVWNNRVYVGIGDHCDNPIQKGRVAAVDLATGAVVAGFNYCSTGPCVAGDTTRGGGVWSPVAAAGNSIYLTTGNTKSGAATEPVPNRGLSMMKVDGTTGAVTWQFQPVPWILDADPDWSAGPSLMSFASCGPRVVSTMKDGWTHALDDNGVRQWTFPPATIPFSPADGTVHADTRYMRSGAVWGDVYITMNGGMNVTTNVTAGYKRLHALNVCAAASDRVRWLIDVPGASGATYSLGPPTVTRGIVYVGTDLGHVVAIADPSLVPPAGYRCIHPDVSTANCVAMGYTLVPQPAVLADVTVTGSMVYTEPAIANGKLYVATGGFGNVGYVYMLSP